jgi:hypothetical protein
MDRRLIPVNAVLALVRDSAGWPNALHDQGFRVHLLEAHVITAVGDAVADVLLYREDPDVVLLVEGKSGRNVQEEQARRYACADVESLRRAGTLPPTLRRRKPVLVAPMFVGLEEKRPGLETSLAHLGIEAPLLTVGQTRVRLTTMSSVPGLEEFDIQHQSGLPPARIKVDHQSQPEELRELLVQQVAAIQARAGEHVDVDTLCRALLPEWSILSEAARGHFKRRVEQVLRGLAQGDMKRDISFEPRTTASPSRIVIKYSPAQLDPRGATQGWQSVERRAARAVGRSPARTQVPGQMSIDELADEGGIAAS